MIKKKISVVALLLFTYVSLVYGQVQTVNYKIVYNETTCLYDCCIVINEGSAKTALHRAQFNAQYSVIVPTGSIVNLVANYNPIQNNQNYAGTLPMVWKINNIIKNPISLKGSDIYSITPTLTPTSFYNNLDKGQTIVLFSLQIFGIKDCGRGVRNFDNLKDPNSSAPGMGGGDFSNGFTLGGVSQKYLSNSPSVLPQKPTVTKFEAYCNNGIEIDLEANTVSCHGSLSYEWNGPLSFKSTSQDVKLLNVNQLNNGFYAVVVKDTLGCTDSLSIEAFAKPSAGVDQFVKCYSQGTATLLTSSNGVWSVAPNSAGTAVIESPLNNSTLIKSFSAPGSYYIIRKDSFCVDTMKLSVGTNCVCAERNTLTISNEHLYCGESSELTLNGNPITTLGTYQWIYKINNQVYGPAYGVNNTEDYQTKRLQVGVHYFRRIFKKTAEINCADTSNVITINVGAFPNAGVNIVAGCFASDTVKMKGITNEGYWRIGNQSAGSVKISSLVDPKAALSGFSKPGKYYMIWTNGLCTDTSIVIANQLCGCTSANAGLDKVVCAGDSLVLTGNCTQGTWKNITLNPLNIKLDTSIHAKATAHFFQASSGTYVFVYELSDEVKDTMTVLVNAKPIIDAGQDFGTCGTTSSIVITASGGVGYMWSNGSTSNSITVNPTVSTKYHVIGSSSNGCSNRDSILISIYSAPVGTIPLVSPIYEGDALHLIAGNWTNAFTYEWTGPNNFSSNVRNPIIPNVSSAHGGTYVLKVTSINDCIAMSSITVVVNPRALAVEFGDFSGLWNPVTKQNEMSWVTLNEQNVSHFELQRSMNGGDFIFVEEVEATGRSGERKLYSFYDDDVRSGNTYIYRIKTIDIDGKISFSSLVSIKTDLDEDFTLSIYPNPIQANQVLYIDLVNPSDQQITVELFNSLGVLMNKWLFMGDSSNTSGTKQFQSNNLSPGVYYIRSIAGNNEITRSIIVL